MIQVFHLNFFECVTFSFNTSLYSSKSLNIRIININIDTVLFNRVKHLIFGPLPIIVISY